MPVRYSWLDDLFENHVCRRVRAVVLVPHQIRTVIAPSAINIKPPIKTPEPVRGEGGT